MTDVHDIGALTRTGPIPVQPLVVAEQDEARQAKPSGTGGDADR